MFRAAPPSDRNAAPIERASAAGYPSVDRYATQGPRKYPHRLNFYVKPPVQEVTVEQFEKWAIDRLRVLAEIESSQARNRPMAETKEAVNALAKKYLPLSSLTAAGMSGGPDLEAERTKDHVSHFVLRLAFCRTEELRRRLVKTETMLFRLRFESDDAIERERFLKTLDFDWIPVSSEEKHANRDALIAANPRLTQYFDNESFYKVHWTRVLDLVERRKVILRAGMAWVPTREQSSLVLSEFSSLLMKELERTARALPRLDEDDRILPVLTHLSMGFMAGITRDSSLSSPSGIGDGKVTAEMVDGLVKTHAPMCMRSLNDSLQRDGHLKYAAREQYLPFIKDIGLSVDEAMLFWRKSFRSATEEKFNKEYKYGVRYAYGLEGRKVNIPGKSCLNIITQNQPGPQDHHGCPFRHFSPQNLSTALVKEYGLNFGEQAEILQSVKNGHYHVGCTRLFELTHKAHGVRKGDGLGEGESVDHPNRYFERSYNAMQSGAGSAKKDEETEETTSSSLQDKGAPEDVEMQEGSEAKRAAADEADAFDGPSNDEEMEMLMAEAAQAEAEEAAAAAGQA